MGSKYEHLKGVHHNKYLIRDIVRLDGKTRFDCLCDCGVTFYVKPCVYKRYRSCGNCPTEDLTGKVFKGAQVLEFLPDHTGKGNIWKCRCSCGKDFEASTGQIRKGTKFSCGCAYSGVKINKRGKLLYGHGYNDCLDSVASNDCKYYRKWARMLNRAYCEKVHKTHPTYTDCEVSDHFKSFKNFKNWCIDYENTHGINIEDYDLDKDLVVKGNKVYSEDTCCFLPSEVNTFLNSEKYKGVSFHKRQEKWTSKIQNPLTGGRLWLGTFENKLSAIKCYKERKQRFVKELSESGILDYHPVLKTYLVRHFKEENTNE